MPYYALTLPNGARLSMLPPSTDYNQAECGVYRWARRGKNGGTMHSSGLKPMNDKDLAAHKHRRQYAKVKREAEAGI